jgi:hypothetical protein
MRRFALFLGQLLLMAPLTMVHASSPVPQELVAPRIILVGYQITGGLKVYVMYNPGRKEIINVWAEDLYNNPYMVYSYSGGISYSGGTIYASNFEVATSAGAVTLDGALTTIVP